MIRHVSVALEQHLILATRNVLTVVGYMLSLVALSPHFF